MKVPDVPGSSQAPTAICLSIQQAHEDAPSTSFGASPAIDRHNPIILSASRRNPSVPLSVVSSKPVLQHELVKSESPKKTSAKHVAEAHQKKKGAAYHQKAKRKSAEKSAEFINSSCVMMSSSDQNLLTPPGSSRYLLSENMLSDGFPDLYPVLEVIQAENNKALALETDDKVPSPSSSLESYSIFSSSEKSYLPSKKKSEEVVVLRVSLHCKGCAAKVRKHISRMEGVTSFNIDFAAKKVTVVGDVTPLGVLATISKVKNAQLWTPETPILSHFPS
uniref:HMA domain-containing protein n=1 Tax=Kalanchoe fedtschenkoi TaxID=63787 RepID=A0A7N0RHT2_KALFE